MTGWRRAIPAGLLAALALGAYADALGNGFVWDDERIIVRNPDTRDLSALPRVVLSPDERPPYYRPLNRASYLIDHRLFGMDPRAFHLVSVLLHTANVLLLYALGLRLLGSRSGAALAAALLAVHPVNAEAVAFLSARNNLFVLLFSLASFFLLLDAGRLRSWARAALSGAAFLLALLSKEQAAVLLPLFAGWLVARANGRERRGAVLLLAPHAAAAAIYLALRAASLGSAIGAQAAPSTLSDRLLRNLDLLPRYLGLVVFPRALSIFHTAPEHLEASAALILAWAAIGGALVLVLRRPTAPALVGLAWFGLGYLPIAGIVPILSTSPLSERHLYFPAVGLWLVAADVAGRLHRISPSRPWVPATMSLALAALTARTAIRNLDWRTDRTLAESAVETEPLAAAAWFNLGVVCKDEGDLDAAARAWEQTLRLDGAHADALSQLGTLAAVRGDLAGAEPLIRRALALDPSIAIGWYNLALVCERTGRPGEAQALFQRFLGVPCAEHDLPAFAANARSRLGGAAPPARPCGR